MAELISFAQNREDVILNAIFKKSKTGFYVDVGANHPVVDSVTKLFYDKGWRGMNIEPATNLYGLLVADRPEDVNLKLGVSNKEGQITFREYPHGDGLSTFSKETQDTYQKSEYYKPHVKDYIDQKVAVTTLKQIFEEHLKRHQIDFMKVDVEGYEYEVIEGNDWTKYRPKVVCIEANHIVNDWHSILKKANYELMFSDGLNEYFVAEEHAQLAADFTFAEAIFLSTPFITWREAKLRLSLGRTERQYRYDLKILGEQKDAQAEAEKLPTSLRSLVMFLIRKTANGLSSYLFARVPTKPIGEPPGSIQLDSENARDFLAASLMNQIRYAQVGWWRRSSIRFFKGLKTTARWCKQRRLAW